MGAAGQAIINQPSATGLTQPPSAARLAPAPSGSLVQGSTSRISHVSQPEEPPAEEDPPQPPQAPALKPLVFGLTEDMRYGHHKNQVKLFLENHNNQ